jgi:hypothetical protein
MGCKQLGFGDYEQTTAQKRTKCERFLAEMEQVWGSPGSVDSDQGCTGVSVRAAVRRCS